MTPLVASPTLPIAVFIIAHPDDESMFFLPTLYHLCNERECWLLCLSNGNYDGLGQEREIELHRAAGFLKNLRVFIVKHAELQDSPTDRWSQEVIHEVLEKHLPHQSPCVLYTFDEHGVSGHVNHLDTYRGVQLYLDKTPSRSGFKLVTVHNPFVKYLPMQHWIRLVQVVWLLGHEASRWDSSNETFTLYRPSMNWKCMAAHASQFVWYRRLFVIFSCYTYENQWQPIV